MISPGSTLGRYRILEQLGEGGAGVVYRAEDSKLERDVAIKVLGDRALGDERARQRFRHEARALSRLVHPNIATLFDFDSVDGMDFLVLEFVPGETLAARLRQGPLPETRARAIGIEVAEALAEAHEHGIVHRDLKPLNIVITPRGRAKVLDFGLARLLGDDAATRLTATGDGAIVGTVQYMAPEQVLGSPVDARTDVYAMGVTLFEMATGELPYPGGGVAAFLFQIANQPARALSDARPGISPEFAAIVARCLDKDPARRFSTAALLADSLRGGGETRLNVSYSVEGDRSARARTTSIAVLPLENRSADADGGFFAEGMTDALIADLTRIGALKVISRTSSTRYKGAQKSLAEIARELRVDAVVEGSVTRSRDRLRVTVQLVDASSDTSLWANSYEGDLSDVLTLQREAARSIAEGIRVKVTPEEAGRLAPQGPVNPKAHLAYLRGRYMWNRWDATSLHESVKCYNESIAADPGYALAWAGLADSYSVLGRTNAMAPDEAFPKARAAAQRGLELDEELAELHTSLGYVLRLYDWDWPAAEREFLRAIALNPGYATAHRMYAQFLSPLGRHEEAFAAAQHALELDPLSLILYTAVGDVLFFARRYDESVTYYQKGLDMDARFPAANTDIARSLDLLGRPDEALEHFVRAVTPEGGDAPPSAGLATLLYRAGRRDAAEAMMSLVLARAGQSYVSPFGVASYYSVAGDADRALDWLERGYTQRDQGMGLLKVHPRLDSLRQEPRFRHLLTLMRLD
jgi:eukaryotic-like serine/threonine-protein kinase